VDRQPARPASSPSLREPTLVSVIIPTLNASGTLPEQLRALSDQAYGAPSEVIIADNGSSDDTTDVAESWEPRLPGLRVIDASQRRGAGHARNAGAAAARGDLLAFCDADDVVERSWLEGLVRAARTSDAVGGRVGASEPLPVSKGFLPWASTSCMAVWKQAFDELGGFDPSFLRAQDVDFSWRVQLAGYRLSPAPEAHIWRRPRDSLAKSASQLFAYGKWSVYLFEQYRAQGVPRRGFRHMVKRLGWLAVRVPYLASGTRRRVWIGVAAKTAGALVGSIRHRVLYLA
jgi:glycosyltransferase involved in cell wall biosynthesis